MLATMSLGVAGLAGASAQGVTSPLDSLLNVPSAVSVPGDFAAGDTAVFPIPSARPAVVDTQDDFDSLSQAVAAQDMPAARSEELTCLAGAIYFESKGEPLAGQLAVAEVILNRARSGRFARTACGVVTQRGQFSFVRGGRVPAIGDSAQYRTAVAVAQVALGDHWDSSASDALFFHARRVSPGWRLQKIASIGNHVFYR